MYQLKLVFQSGAVVEIPTTTVQGNIDNIVTEFTNRPSGNNEPLIKFVNYGSNKLAVDISELTMVAMIWTE